MSQGRHSYIDFYPSDWLGGTARMTRTHKSVFFDICLYIWDKAESCPQNELPLMLGDLDNWQDIVDDLIAAKKLKKTRNGNLINDRALATARRSLNLWKSRVEAGKRGAQKTNKNKELPGPATDKPPAIPPQNQNQNQNQNQSKKDSVIGKPKSSKLSLDWSPTDEYKKYAAEYGFTGRGYSDLNEGFHEYWTNGNGRGKTKISWFRTYQTWVRNQTTQRGQSTKKQKAHNQDEILSAIHSSVRNELPDSVVRASPGPQPYDGETNGS